MEWEDESEIDSEIETPRDDACASTNIVINAGTAVVQASTSDNAVTYRAPDLIKKKRDGSTLTHDEFRYMLKGLESEEEVTQEQVGAFLMACHINGLSDDEKKVFGEDDLKNALQDTFGLVNIDKEVSAEHKSVAVIITNKATGGELHSDEIKAIVNGSVQILNEESNPTLTKAQLGAWLMAVFLKGMSTLETVALTQHMLDSGDKITWDAEDPRPVVDKHSTGGVGDTMTLPLAPCLAALGLRAPLLAGRGLGHTGGTLDKLESIQGYETRLPVDQMKAVVQEIGCVVCGQTAKVTPADKILYATRDITSTVDNISLITASIISKKAAAGAKFMVLDVKVGEGAFMTNIDDARQLANSLIDVSHGLGMETDAVLTRMDDPIGKYVGNALEVLESIDVLCDRGPSDSVEIICTLGAQLLLATGKVSSREQGVELVRDQLRSGKALENFAKMAKSSNADAAIVDNLCNLNNLTPHDFLPKSQTVTELTAATSGLKTNLKYYYTPCDLQFERFNNYYLPNQLKIFVIIRFVERVKAMPIATVSNELGAGRARYSSSHL